MKRLASAAAVALACLGLAGPADATVLEITTSIPATADEANFERAVERAVRTAVEEVRLESASSFTPTMIVITRAMTIGERIYVRILLSDDTPATPPAVAPTDI